MDSKVFVLMRLLNASTVWNNTIIILHGVFVSHT